MRRARWAMAAMAAVAGCQGSPRPETVPSKQPAEIVTPATTFPAATPVATGRPTTVPVDLKFSPKSIDQILAGTKTSTTRKGNRAINVGPLRIGDPARVLTVTVTAVQHKTLDELTADDARTDGTLTLDALRAAMIRDYPDLKGGDGVTVIKFAVPPR